jgi:RNA ligase (TIGR02306 family)
MKLATFETINNIQPIPGADRIELATVQGWQSVIKKGDFKVGDQVIFVPIDTVMEPREWNKFLWNKEDPSKPIRIKTAKLKSTISQGIIFPMSVIDDCTLTTEPNALAAVLGITKYEKPIPAHLSGQVKGDFPSYLVSKTDEDNLKSNISVLEELRNADYVEATVKLDGTSATYIKDQFGEFRVCSRNLELKDTEENVHWKMARKYNIKDLLQNNECIQGEICGPGIQGNPVGVSELSFYLFNFKKDGKWSSYEHLKDKIPTVSTTEKWTKEEFAKLTLEDLQTRTNMYVYGDSNKPAEGLVFRGFNKEKQLLFSPTLQKMLSVKIINQRYND